MREPWVGAHNAGGRACVHACDIDRDLHGGNRSSVLEPVCGVPVLGPAHSRPIVCRHAVAVVGDRPLENEHGARSVHMAVNRTEDASRLDGHPAHPQLAPRHALDLGAKVKRRKQLHHDAFRLGCQLFAAHSTLLCAPPGTIVALRQALAAYRWPCSGPVSALIARSFGRQRLLSAAGASSAGALSR